jgi:sec-independent protein translocase protein TatC
VAEELTNKKKIKKPEKRYVGILTILGNIRSSLIKSLVVVTLLSLIAFLFKDVVFKYIVTAPSNPQFITNRLLCKLGHIVTDSDILCINQNILELWNIKFSGQFNDHIYISFVLGLTASFPVIAYLIWGVLKPLISRTNRIRKGLFIWVVSILFIIGVLFGYFIVMPLTINFLYNYELSSQINNQIVFSSYFRTFTSVVLAGGVVFELPVFIILLSKMGILSRKKLKRFRKVSFIIFLTISAIITPPDLFSQILVALPLTLLYEISILLIPKER